MCRHAGGSTGMPEKLSAVLLLASRGPKMDAQLPMLNSFLKVTGLHHSTDDERRRFDEILADDEELAVFHEEYWCTPRWYGWIAGVRAVVGRWHGESP
jgi:hypothetical protein